jgi:hypothetical protein
MSWMWDAWNWFVNFLSAEFILTRRANSGSVVLLRALWSAFWIMVIAIILNSILDNGITCNPELTLIWKGFQAHPTWYAIVFAAVYTALYTRFANQWQYLAKLYNDLKVAEINHAKENTPLPAVTELLVKWQAAFVSDAIAMHLVSQDSFATAVGRYLDDQAVRKLFIDLNKEETFKKVKQRLDRAGVKLRD